jgi:hypothetical protein
MTVPIEISHLKRLVRLTLSAEVHAMDDRNLLRHFVHTMGWEDLKSSVEEMERREAYNCDPRAREEAVRGQNRAS